MTSIANVQTTTAGLAPDSTQTISGIAVGIDDVTRGLERDRKVWRAAELREAAASLEGTAVNPLHSQADVGEVVRAGFDPDRGVIYEAEIEDEGLAEQVASGGLEVSIEARHADGGAVETDHGEAMLATDIEFTGMALVQHGAAPSASASPGEAAALSPADIHETLTATLASADFDEGDLVRWSTSASPGSGRVADVVTEAGETVTANGADVTREATEDEAAYKLDNWTGSEAGFDEGAVVKSASELLGAWGDAPEEARMAYGGEDADMADIPDEYVFTNPGEAVSKASEMGFDGAGDEMIHTHDDGSETVFMPGPSHEDLLGALHEDGALAPAGTDDPDEGEVLDGSGGDADTETTHTAHMSEDDDTDDIEEELRARLSEKDDRIAELEQENSELKDEREDVARAYASALADAETVFDEDELVERFEVSELAAKVEDSESATLADTEPTVQSGGGESSEEATLSESEQADVADHREVIADLAGKDGVARHERERRASLVAEITGEDPDTILEQEA